ncbi:MAG TPA: NAD(P)H-hydrate epimerase, partial [Gemmatirosa sp.]|nr:NAD(P)H-hydrate epimerase [Gemmatirosa sp.]
MTDATEAAARDAAAIAAGVPSRALMQRAGAAAAAELARRFGDRLAGGVAVWAGPGNNGGDAWVVAGALLRLGIAVRVAPVGGDAPRTVDAAFERERVLAAHAVEPPRGDEALVVDGVLGTGAQGAPRGWAADAVRAMARRGSGGAAVVALDVPTGLHATTGETFG